MKSLREYLKESEDQYSRPVRGDNFAINIREECLLETYIVDETDDGIVLHADDKMISLLESYGFLSDGDISQLEKDIAAAPVKPIASMEAQDVPMADAGEYDFEGDMAKDDLETIVRAARRLTGMLDDNENMPEWVQSKINKAADYVDTAADYIESNQSEQGVSEGSGQYRVTLTLKDDSAGPGESATQRVNVSVSATDEQSAIAQAKQKLIKSPKYSGSRIVGAKIQQGVAEGEDDLVDLGPALRNLTGEFNKFMKHDDRMKTDPAYAKKWNKRYAKYAGNDDHSIYDDPDDDKEQGVAEGLGDDNSIWNQYGHYTKQDLMKEFPNITPQDAQSIVNYAEYGWSPHVDAQKFRNEVVKRIKIAMGQQGMDEAKYQGREVPLGKPMKGDVKKSKVYVRGPKGNVVKVNFGQKGMKIKKNIPGRRKNFRARHNCDNPGPRWKARYWSCRAW